MPLPDLIEIVPLADPVRAEITVPGSKSITNRALILAALAHGPVRLEGALWSEDTQVMVECLHALGFAVEVADDPGESCNRTITVQGLGGKIPRGGTAEKPLELFVGNAGTAARFLAALVCLGNGVYRLSGVARMHERPQAALFQALRELGYRVDSEGGRNNLPAVIHGAGPNPGANCTVSIDDSSQFASALLLGAGTGGWSVKVRGENAEESPYVAMTTELIKAFPLGGGDFQIEPDASSGSYFWGANLVAPALEGYTILANHEIQFASGSQISVLHWPTSGWQIDAAFLKTFLSREKDHISRFHDIGDSIMTAITLCPVIRHRVVTRFTDLGRLRVQECERVRALHDELRRCGASIREEGDSLTIEPSELHGAEIETYNDHRMAMCFAILGLKVPGIKIKNPACVKKTFPNFFQKLATSPPHGLGAAILDAAGRRLSPEELFAD